MLILNRKLFHQIINILKLNLIINAYIIILFNFYHLHRVVRFNIISNDNFVYIIILNDSFHFINSLSYSINTHFIFPSIIAIITIELKNLSLLTIKMIYFVFKKIFNLNFPETVLS